MQDISSVIRLLLSAKDSPDEMHLMESIIQLCMYLRYPIDEADRDAASLGGFMSLLLGKFGDLKISSLPVEIKETIMDRYNVSTLYYICNNLVESDVYYDVKKNAYGYRSDFNFITKVVHFLLWYKPQSNRKRDGASLKKAHLLLSNTKFYGEKWRNIAWTTFRRRWLKYVDASAFIYVNYNHYRNFLHLDPRSPDFATSVSKIASDHQRIERYLENVAWVYQALDEILDYRTPLNPSPLERLVTPVPLDPIKMRSGVTKLLEQELARVR